MSFQEADEAGATRNPGIQGFPVWSLSEGLAHQESQMI